MEKLHKEERHVCYCLPGIIREINTRKTKLVRNVACVGGTRNERTYFQAENLRRRDHLKIPRVRGSVILKWIFKRDRVELCGLKSVAQDKDQCSYAPCDDSSGSIIWVTFLNYFIYNQVFAFSSLINLRHKAIFRKLTETSLKLCNTFLILLCGNEVGNLHQHIYGFM
jgi:hypothetical protein